MESDLKQKLIQQLSRPKRNSVNDHHSVQGRQSPPALDTTDTTTKPDDTETTIKPETTDKPFPETTDNPEEETTKAPEEPSEDIAEIADAAGVLVSDIIGALTNSTQDVIELFTEVVESVGEVLEDVSTSWNSIPKIP